MTFCGHIFQGFASGVLTHYFMPQRSFRLTFAREGGTGTDGPQFRAGKDKLVYGIVLPGNFIQRVGEAVAGTLYHRYKHPVVVRPVHGQTGFSQFSRLIPPHPAAGKFHLKPRAQKTNAGSLENSLRFGIFRKSGFLRSRSFAV
jgi:hypothetical protein